MSAEDDLDNFIQEQKRKIAREREDLQHLNGKQIPTNGYQNGGIIREKKPSPNSPTNLRRGDKSGEAGLPVGNYITTKEKLQKERQEEYQKFIQEKNNRSSSKRTTVEGDGMSLPIGERLSAQDRARMQRNKEYNEFLKQKGGPNRRKGQDQEPALSNGVGQHQAPSGPPNGYRPQQASNGYGQQQQANDPYNAPRIQREASSQTPVPRGYDDLPPRPPRKGWGTPQPIDYDDLLRRKREEETRYRRYDDVDLYRPRLKPAHSDPYLNRYDDDGRRSTRPEYYDDYDRRRVRFSDEVPSAAPRDGPPYSDRSARPRQRESLEEPILYDWSRSRGGRSRTFTDGERPKPAIKQQEDPERQPRAKSASLAEDTGLPLGQRDTGSATRRKKEQYRKELERQMEEAKAAKQREKALDRSPGFAGSNKPPVAPQQQQQQQPPPQGYTPSFHQQQQDYGNRPQPVSATPYAGPQYGIQELQGPGFNAGSRAYSQVRPPSEPIGDLGLREALARSQPERLDRPFSLNYPQPSTLNQPSTNTDPYMYYGLRNPLEPDPNPKSQTGKTWVGEMTKSLSNLGGTVTGKNADAFSVSSRPNKLDDYIVNNPATQSSSRQVKPAQVQPQADLRGQRAKTPYHPVPADAGQQSSNRVHNPPFATYGSFGNPGSAGQRSSVKLVNPSQNTGRPSQVNPSQANQGRVRFSENQPAVIPNTGFNPRQQSEMQNTFQRLVKEYKVNPSAAAASFQAIPPTQQDNLLQFLQAYSSYLKYDSASNISEPLFGLQAFRDRVKADTIQDMASAYESLVHGLPHPSAAAGSSVVPPLSNLNSPLMERYLLLQQQQQQLLQQQQQLEQQLPPSLIGPNQLNQQLNNPVVSKQAAAQFRGESAIKNFVGDSNLSPRSQANASSYREQLLLQMKEKEAKKNADIAARVAYEAKKEKEIEIYDPWGKGGGGAPMRDKQGKIVADLKQLHNRNETILNDPNRKDLQLYAGSANAPPNPAAAQGPGQEVSPLLAAAASAGVGSGPAPGPAYGKIKGSITGPTSDPVAESNRNEYQDQLRQQVEEKKRRELEEKEKIRLEEEKEERRLAAQRERIQREYEAELERKKQKEEAQRKQKEDLEKQLEDKRKEAEAKKKEANEKRRREAEEKLRHRDINHNVNNLSLPRGSSPPIPALRTKEPELQRITSPPIPTHQKKEDRETKRPPPEPARRSTQSPPVPTLQKKEKKVVEPDSKEDGDRTDRSHRRGSRRQSLAPEPIDGDLQKTPRKGPSRNEEGERTKRSRRPRKGPPPEDDVDENDEGEISPDKTGLEEEGAQTKRSRRPRKEVPPADGDDGEVSPDKEAKTKRSRRPRKERPPGDDADDGETSPDKTERTRRSRRPRKEPTPHDDEEPQRDEETPRDEERIDEEETSRKPRKRRPRPKQGEEPSSEKPSDLRRKSVQERARIFPPKEIPQEHAELDPLDKLRNPTTIPVKSSHPRVIPDENARLSPMDKLRTHYPEEPQKPDSFLDSGLFPETKGGFEAAYKKQRYLVDWLREIDPDLVVYAAALAENGYKTWNTIRRLKRGTLLELCPDIKHGHIEAILHEVNRGQTPRSKKPSTRPQVRSPDSLSEQELDIADIESSKTRPAPIRRKEKQRRLEDISPRNGRYSESPPGNSFVDFLVNVSKESEMYKKAQRLQNKLQRDGHMQDDADFPSTSERSSSPPVPAVSTKERGGPKDDTNVMGALSAMRVQLAYEQQRVQSQLDKHRDYDPYNPLPKAAHAPRRGSPQVDVFELARHKGSVAVMRNMTHQAAEDFDGLKNRSGSRTRQKVKESYPHKPDSDVTLEAQQRALLRAQQEKLEAMRKVYGKGRKATTNDIPRISDIGRGSPAIPLDSDSAFIGIDSGEAQMPKTASRPTRSSAVPSPVDRQPRKTGRSVSRLDNDDLDKIIAKSQARSDAIETLHDRDSDPDDILNKFLSKKSYDSRPPSGKSEDLSLWLKPSLGQT
ncbi:centrosome and spindle pole-associated protein 1-like isoform X2 [Lytechinus variegatus]|uniref:centrosome and spindle pole-associated protein 1-like isoform X2 n=1 Tax=Lytechinus variegatus TaxID=7654 RepID=UPI001BB284D5|nr:centrosome and spindle pole-associated protein 1-like isoform X2 [Lytechinus variegatus]